jgi:hypothetical protein
MILSAMACLIFGVAVDPVEAGLVASLNRPGGNLTGVTNLNVEVGPKRLELVHELLPTPCWSTRLALILLTSFRERCSKRPEPLGWSFMSCKRAPIVAEYDVAGLNNVVVDKTQPITPIRRPRHALPRMKIRNAAHKISEGSETPPLNRTSGGGVVQREDPAIFPYPSRQEN